MPARSLIALAASLGLVLAACGDVTEPAAATVNGHKILVSDVNAELSRFVKTPGFDQLSQQSGPEQAKRQFEQGFLGQEIRRAVLTPAAADLGVQVTDAEVQSRIDQIKKNFPSEAAFQKALEDQGFTLDKLAQFVRDQVLEQKLRARVTTSAGPSRKELQTYYRAHRSAYRQTQVQHILVKDPKLAATIAHRLRQAPSSRLHSLFAALARKYSTDTTNKDKGGKLGWVSAGALVAPFERAMDKLSVGRVSDPVKTQFGYHVILVTGRRLQHFGQVEAQIRSQLGGSATDQAFQRWLAKAYGRADVEINPRYGVLDPSTGQIVNETANDVPGAASPSPSPSPS